MSPKLPSSSRPRKGLVAVIGAFAAMLAVTMTAREESGREVKVEMVGQDQLRVKHLAGRQYLDAYLDIVGVATICDGLTRGVRLGMKMTEAQCADALEAELAETAEAIMACSSGLRGDKAGYFRAASVVMAHNIGAPGWCGSSVRKLLDAGRIVPAGDAMLAWNKGRFPASQIARRRAMGSQCAQGRDAVWRCTISGLTSRRQREREVFLTGQPGYPASTLAARVARWK